MVEWTALEMRHTGDCIQGSNPCLSAKSSYRQTACSLSAGCSRYYTGMLLDVIGVHQKYGVAHNNILFVKYIINEVGETVCHRI